MGTHLQALPIDNQSEWGVFHLEKLTVASEMPKFFPTWGFVCGCVDSREPPAGVGRWKHTWWFWVTSCLRHTLPITFVRTHLLVFCCSYRWFTLMQAQGRTFKAAATNADDSKKEAKRQRAAFLSSPFPSFVLPASRTLGLMHPRTHKHTHQ